MCKALKGLGSFVSNIKKRNTSVVQGRRFFYKIKGHSMIGCHFIISNILQEMWYSNFTFCFFFLFPCFLSSFSRSSSHSLPATRRTTVVCRHCPPLSVVIVHHQTLPLVTRIRQLILLLSFYIIDMKYVGVKL